MERTPYARIDFEPSPFGGITGKLGICPYAAVFETAGADTSQTVTDLFVPQAQLWNEIVKLSGLPQGTEITPNLVEVIGIGCQERGGHAVARLQWVSGVTIASPRLAEDVLRRRGFDAPDDEPTD